MLLRQNVSDRRHIELLVRRHLIVWLRHLQRDQLRSVERLGVFPLVDVASTRVGARLEYRPEPAVGIPQTNGVNRLAHGGRVMREVVDDENTVWLAARLLSSLHPRERREAGADLRTR